MIKQTNRSGNKGDSRSNSPTNTSGRNKPMAYKGTVTK